MNAQLEIKKNIRENLPYGGLTMVAKAINLKNKRKVSISHVGNVLNPSKKTWDTDVISTAQKIILRRQKDLMHAVESMIPTHTNITGSN